MAENVKAGKNKIGVNQRNPRLTISSCRSLSAVALAKADVFVAINPPNP